MVTNGYRKIFIDKKKLYLLINFAIEGYSANSLSLLFHCDKTSVRAQCRKYHVKAFPFLDDLSLLKRNADMIKVEAVRAVGERINAGKRSYADYLACSPVKNRAIPA